MYYKVHVVTEIKKESVVQKSADTYIVSVAVAAKQNQANKRMCVLLAPHLGISPKEIRLISGHTAPHKIIRVVKS